MMGKKLFKNKLKCKKYFHKEGIVKLHPWLKYLKFGKNLKMVRMPYILAKDFLVEKNY
jgi:hypothetical protein